MNMDFNDTVRKSFKRWKHEIENEVVTTAARRSKETADIVEMACVRDLAINSSKEKSKKIFINICGTNYCFRYGNSEIQLGYSAKLLNW